MTDMKPLIMRVLFVTDFSRCAGRALNYTLAIATTWKAGLQITLPRSQGDVQIWR